jgi:hypothetical protein
MAETDKSVIQQIARAKQQGGRTWSEEQKAAQREKMRAYWATHEHPRRGMPTSEETKERQRQAQLSRTPLASCIMCEGELFTEDTARRGVGDDCLARGLEEGYLRLEEDGTVTYLEEA